MGCGCSSASSSSQKKSKVQSAEALVECSYTREQIDEWLTRVMCFKDKELWRNTSISKKIINRYIVVLTAAKNNVNNPCFFARKLRDVESFITVITAIGQC